MSIARKVLIITLMPMIAYWVLSWRFLDSSLEDHFLGDDMLQHYLALHATSDLVHELQKERGISSLYASGGVEIAVVKKQRNSTDEKIDLYTKAIQESQFADSIINKCNANLDSLKILRKATDEQQNPAGLRKGYSGLIKQELKLYANAINGKTSKGVGKGWTSLSLLEEAKEASGQLRTAMASLAKRDSALSMEEIKQLQKLYARVQVNLESPGLALSKATKERLKAVEADPIKAQVDQVFWTLIEKSAMGMYGLNGKEVFDLMTKRIDQLNSVLVMEYQVGQEKLLVQNAEADHSILISIVMTIATSVLLLVMLIWFSIQLRKGFAKAERIVEQVSHGNLPEIASQNSKDELGRLQNQMGEMVQVLRSLLTDMAEMADQHNVGQTDHRIDTTHYKGSYRNLAEGLNEMADGHIQVNQKTVECIAAFGHGNFDIEVEKFPGKRAEINHTIEEVRSKLKALIDDASMLAQAALEGRLQVRAEETKHSGDFRKIIMGVNQTMDAVISPITEASAVLQKVANRNLTMRMMGEYQGDLAKMKIALNQAIDNLDLALFRVAESTSQVATASRQISAGSETLAQGSSEQASALEQVTSSMEVLNSMTQANAASASEAKVLADDADQKAHKGIHAVKSMEEAIGKIQSGSKETAKIIKTIDEIAMQTNLLALNAAVEAARAGEAGRGFAVVAEEVRNLAIRSAQAARSTAERITESVNNADEGVDIAQSVSKSFEGIAQSTSKVNQLIHDIAKASQEQSLGLSKVSHSIQEMDKLTQGNAANAEESASASEELSSQAEELMDMVNGFQITKSNMLQGKNNSMRLLG